MRLSRRLDGAGAARAPRAGRAAALRSAAPGHCAPPPRCGGWPGDSAAPARAPNSVSSTPPPRRPPTVARVTGSVNELLQILEQQPGIAITHAEMRGGLRQRTLLGDRLQQRNFSWPERTARRQIGAKSDQLHVGSPVMSYAIYMNDPKSARPDALRSSAGRPAVLARGVVPAGHRRQSGMGGVSRGARRSVPRCLSGERRRGRSAGAECADQRRVRGVVRALGARAQVTRPALFLKVALACLMLEPVLAGADAARRRAPDCWSVTTRGWRRSRCCAAVGVLSVVSARRTSKTPTAGTPA